LSAAGVNVISIHSRLARSGGLHLFLEVEGHANDPLLLAALASLQTSGLSPTICGSYPRFY